MAFVAEYSTVNVKLLIITQPESTTAA